MDRAPSIISIGPLINITFSQWIALNQCPLKGALRSAILDGELPMPPMTRASLVGIFHHEAMEQVALERSPDVIRRTLEGRIEEMQRIVSNLPHLRRFGSVSGWPEINRSVTIAQELSSWWVGTEKFDRRAHTELDLQSKSKLLKGRPDFFSVHESVADLREYKSGVIRETNGLLRCEYLDQVKFYSYLIVDTFQVETVNASIESLSGDRCEEQISLEQALRFGAAVEMSLTEFNRENEKCETWEVLAAPTRDACTFCLGRPVCRPFKKSQDQLGLEGEQYVLEGHLLSLEKTKLGNVAAVKDVYREKRLELLIPEEVCRELRLEKAYMFMNLRRQGPMLSWGNTSRVLRCD
jgi:PD-(D/E)XK nuclease superfamily